jgi:hypothetical protein
VIEFSGPFVMLLHHPKPTLLGEFRSGSTASLQRRLISKQTLETMSVLDSSCKYYEGIQFEVEGIDWDSYREGGLLSVLLVPFDMLLRADLTRVKILAATVREVSLDEAKMLIADHLEVAHVSWAPEAELRSRVRRALNCKAMIRSILRD